MEGPWPAPGPALPVSAAPPAPHLPRLLHTHAHTGGVLGVFRVAGSSHSPGEGVGGSPSWSVGSSLLRGGPRGPCGPFLFSQAPGRGF